MNVIRIALGVIITAVLMYGYHMIAYGIQERRHSGEIKAISEQCEKAQTITSEVSNEYQQKLADRDRALAAARRMLNNSGNQSSSSGGYNAATGSRKPYGQNVRCIEADPEELIDIASDGEKYRLQLMGCQSFVRKLDE